MRPSLFSSAAVPAALLVAVLALAAGPAEARLTNEVTEWINATQAAVSSYGIQNQLSSKYYGAVSLAILAALDKGGAPEAALAAFAGHAVLSASFPWQQSAVYDKLLKKQLGSLSAGDVAAARKLAVPIGNKLAAERTGGPSTEWADFKPAAAGTPFAYQFTPDQTYALYPQLANAVPFVLAQPDVPTIAAAYKPPKTDYASVATAGAKSSPSRAQYDTDSAFFWADGANTSAITGHWADIAREVLPADFSLHDTALFFARAFAAAYDASIVAWKIKYSQLHWRPITALRQGVPGQFAAQADWTPLLKTPAHPEYPSGHQTSVGAILEVLVKTLGTDAKPFTISSEGRPDLTRSYKTLTQAADEVGYSRYYAGVHFDSANRDGLKLGRQVGGKVFEAIQKGGSARTSGGGLASLFRGRRL